MFVAQPRSGGLTCTRIGETVVDAILLIGVILLILALLGVGGVIGALKSVAWILLLVAIIVIAWRVITGRKPV